MKTVTLIAIAAGGLGVLALARKAQKDGRNPYAKVTVGANPYTPQKTTVGTLLPAGFFNPTPINATVSQPLSL